MPEFTTHYLFGKSVINDYSSSIKNTIEDNKSAYKWGLQGPDLLFYSTVFRDSGRMARAGSALHHSDPEAIFSNVLDYIVSKKGTSDYDGLCAYFYGFICHYALDTTTHPFVYSCIVKQDGQVTSKRHIQIESEIGSLLYGKLTGMPVSGFNIYNHYSKNGDFVEPVSRMYVYLIKKILDKTVYCGEVKSGFSWCLFLNCYTYLLACKELDSNSKTMILKSVQAVLSKSDFLTSFIKCDNVETDALNLMHKSWCNLNEPEKVYSYSFPDLFDIAKKHAAELSEKCCRILESGKVVPLGLSASFDNGEPEKKCRVNPVKLKFEKIKSRA